MPEQGIAVDPIRRETVMSRSQKLGHCVCNLKQPCPCPELVEQNICHCAGERPANKPKNIALTKHVRKAGCASKIGQADLLQIIKNLPSVTDPRVLLGAAAGDDAGVYRLDEHRSLVQTVDVFTPCVDDPYLFGQIAAANSLSDVYAMGGQPLTALSIVGFPIDELDGSIMEAMLRGGMDKLAEANCALLGGHSINDPEIKCGFAVTGLIDTERVVARDRALPGDVLVLTKPLGTGLAAYAAQLGRCEPDALTDAGMAMATLNKDAAELMCRYQAHACTDITGFGLAGHLVSMARGSGVVAEVDMTRLPVFGIAAACLREEILPGAVDRNRAYAMAWMRITDDGHPENLPILFDPQTSGGLLIALPEDRAAQLVADLNARGHKGVAVIGRIRASEDGEGRVAVTNTQLSNFVGALPSLKTATTEESHVTDSVEDGTSCCGDLFEEQGTNEAEVLAVFQDFMKKANEPGRIDRRAKKLMAVILSIAHKCKPCLAIHLKGALAMGISQAEIDEAANLAIAFGGCTAMVFYKEAVDELAAQRAKNRGGKE
ncbi:MAG: selenide, water dikinase SelD [Candidatus Hydrogenedentes bacterium]|nr:selenide, water dikinase SelD [Candidatus Hydrogenedentota bacterium]